MRGAAASRRYARAIFQLAAEQGERDALLEEMRRLGGLLDENAELAAVLYRPLHPVAERRAAFEAVAGRLGLSGLARQFVTFLIQQRRMVAFPAVLAELERLADEAAGKVEAEVVSASALGDRQLERVRQALAERTGRDVRVAPRVDPALIGGIVARVGDLVFDGSIRTQLEQLRSNLTRER